MKIKAITEEFIEFDNGKTITYDHEHDCCEWNHADFEQLDSIGREYDFKEPLLFEAIQDCGFRFGNENAMFFIPCYSDQNGYYTAEIDIYYDGKRVLHFDCEERDY